MATVVSVFELPSKTASAIRKLKDRGFDDLTTYSPAPFPEIEEAEDPRPSKEMTILLGGFFTLFGLLIVGRLYPRRLDKHYSSRFSAEEFGVVVNCEERDVSEVEMLLRGESAKEVTVVDS